MRLREYMPRLTLDTRCRYLRLLNFLQLIFSQLKLLLILP
jgi:hypothetical protein